MKTGSLPVPAGCPGLPWNPDCQPIAGPSSLAENCNRQQTSDPEVPSSSVMLFCIEFPALSGKRVLKCVLEARLCAAIKEDKSFRKNNFSLLHEELLQFHNKITLTCFYFSVSSINTVWCDFLLHYPNVTYKELKFHSFSFCLLVLWPDQMFPFFSYVSNTAFIQYTCVFTILEFSNNNMLMQNSSAFFVLLRNIWQLFHITVWFFDSFLL